jgi:hypothetical protein
MVYTIDPPIRDESEAGTPPDDRRVPSMTAQCLELGYREPPADRQDTVGTADGVKTKQQGGS